jgi:rare lipoprotein A
MARALALVALFLAACATAPAPPPRSTISQAPPARDEVRGRQEGMASWYGKEQHGHLTANGERFDMHALTAAHRSLPMQTRVRVTNRSNGASVVVRINDRGPYSKKRIIDVSYAAARVLGMIERGVVPVLLEVLR